jgi:hypothetical protein
MYELPCLVVLPVALLSCFEVDKLSRFYILWYIDDSHDFRRFASLPCYTILVSTFSKLCSNMVEKLSNI